VIALVAALLEFASRALTLAITPDPEAERQLMLDVQRKASDELARREFAAPVG
jgi:hypothetical protein